MRRCVWSRNLMNEEAMDRVGPQRHKKEKKSKADPLQAWSGPEGSRKLKFPDFTTTARDGSKVLNLTHRPPLTPGNTPGTHFC